MSEMEPGHGVAGVSLNEMIQHDYMRNKSSPLRAAVISSRPQQALRGLTAPVFTSVLLRRKAPTGGESAGSRGAAAGECAPLEGLLRGRRPQGAGSLLYRRCRVHFARRERHHRRRGAQPGGGRCGEMWGDVGRCGEVRGDVRRDVRRCAEMCGDVRRCGEMWGDVGRCGEMLGLAMGAGVAQPEAGQCLPGGGDLLRRQAGRRDAARLACAERCRGARPCRHISANLGHLSANPGCIWRPAQCGAATSR